MKIGILTVYSFNYGSYFQATALYNELKKLGFEVEFINEKFKKYKWGNLFLLYSFDQFMPNFAKKLISDVLPQYRTYLQLKNDVKNYKESPNNIHSMKKITKNYDLVILGADEMWSANDKSIRYTKEHFGYDISCPHISYATCGSLFDMTDKELMKKAAHGLKSFKAISVRDSYTKKVVKKLTGYDAEIVLDPTLLNPYFIHDYEKITDDKEKYVLLYGQHYDDDQKKYIINLAKEKGCKIKSLGWPIDFSDEFLDPKTADEFQGCFAKAEFCFPSTFHGTIFSILNHKPFLSMVNSLRGKKIKMLLDYLKLSDRIFDKDILNYDDIDYELVEARLEEKRKLSKSVLISSINKAVHMSNAENMLNGYTRCKEQEIICDDSKCTGCFACLNACRQGAISSKQNNEGFYRPVIDKSKCIDCGVCKKVCPSNNPVKTYDFDSKYYAAFLTNDNDRLSSSSGGAFYSIAKKFIENDGVVYGAAFTKDKSENNQNELIVKHIKVSSLEELKLLKGSKYVQSNVHSGIASALQNLKNGKKVLFSGTPCQIAAIKKLAGNNPNLFTIDILCHGVPSPQIFSDYVKYMSKINKSKVTNLSFRNKKYGWTKQAISLEFKNGKEYINTTDKDPYYVMYFKHIMLNQACHSCAYTNYSRVGDITLGDFWGIDKVISRIKKNDLDMANNLIANKEKGISLLMINTEKGEELLSDVVDLNLIETTKEETYQPILKSASIVSKNRDEFWKDYNSNGIGFVINKYGKLKFTSWFIKKVAVPALKICGIYDIVQKMYFGRNSRK